MIRPGKLPSHYGPASALGISVGACCFVVLSKVLCEFSWPLPISYWDQHMTGWLAIRLHAIEPSFFAEIAARYQAYLDHLPPGVDRREVTTRFDLAMLISVIVGMAVALLLGRPFSDTKILAGRRLFEGKAAHRQIGRVAKEEIARSGLGVKLHKSFKWAMSRDRETTHFWMIGSVGSGTRKHQRLSRLLCISMLIPVIHHCFGNLLIPLNSKLASVKRDLTSRIS